jgi:hypothetical protein
MCARRFLGIVFFLTLLAVAGAFAVYQWGGNVLLKGATPQGHFQKPASMGPDYRSTDAWLTRPGIYWPDNPVEWKPVGAPTPEAGARPAAVFYVHPTTYLERDRWNAPLKPSSGYADFRTTLFLQSQASAFSDIGEVWAPRYRQAAFGAFLLKSEDAQKALDVAYGDVATAFEQFVRDTGDRPIILAGHSQGALHLERLLRERIAGKPVARRIVAAYVVGWPISRTTDLPRLGFPACASLEQGGCILSWMSFGDPANPNLILDQWEKTRGFTGGERRQADMLCVNPITGTLDGAAAAGQNAGTLVPSADLSSATLQPGLVGARCDKRLLMLDGAIPPLGPYVLPGNNYHVYDYALFWGAIRQDAMRRVAAWHR